MNARFPNPEDRKRVLQAFYQLPPQDKQILYKAVEHLRWLTILWGLEDLNPTSIPSLPEKRHILLAYKLLQILWFAELPEKDHKTFTVYVRERLPEDQDPALVSEIFEMNSEELATRSQSLTRPKWVTKEAKAIQISLESFPSKV